MRGAHGLGQLQESARVLPQHLLRREVSSLVIQSGMQSTFMQYIVMHPLTSTATCVPGMKYQSWSNVCHCHRMFSSGKALAFGEDFTTDPVSRMLGIGLLVFSGGQLRVDLQMFSQVLHIFDLMPSKNGMRIVLCLAEPLTPASAAHSTLHWHLLAASASAACEASSKR